ncbi:uncharacterized protein LOC142564421 [Dermacentor variabilis]|uniref:uncharacterized protein LOC142564421 n=1 Tax=Dermacentor variabilis TaxID=34621 RepID=UPI003F5BADBE
MLRQNNFQLNFHFNENSQREQGRSCDGAEQWRIKSSKVRQGTSTACALKTAPTFDYVKDLHKKVMELCAEYETFSKALAQVEESVPAAFSSRDDQRVPKRDLVAAHKARFLKF